MNSKNADTENGEHGFAHIDESRPEMCLCGAAFVYGYRLDVAKRAHLEAASVNA